MATTATNVIAKFRVRYPDCDTTTAQALLDDVLKEVYTRIDIRGKEITLDVTDGTREYDLNVDITSIKEVIYKPSSSETAWVVLRATNIDLLDAQNPYWRTDLTESAPTYYYVRGAASTDTAKNVIGFINIPPTTTSGGYPIIAIQCTQWAQVSTSETLPSNLLNDNVIVYGMRFYWAVEKGLDDQIRKWKELYEDEIGKNAIHVRGLSGDDDPQYLYSPVFTLTPSV